MLIGSIARAIITHGGNIRIQDNINRLFDIGRIKSMNIPRLVVIVVISLLFTFSTYAQPAGNLTRQNIEGYLDSIRDMKKISKKYNTEEIVSPGVSASESMAQGNDPFSAGITQMQGHKAYDEMLAVIERHGFSDIQQWGATGERIIRAFAANSVETEMPAMDKQMQQALEEIEKSDLSDTQKDAMRQMMESSLQMMNSYTDASGADRAAVLPFMSAIEALGQQ
jgi:hypothetical protein